MLSKTVLSNNKLKLCFLGSYGSCTFLFLSLKLQLVHEKIIESKKDPTCCTSNHSNNKCWRHSMKFGKRVNLRRTKAKSGWITWLKSCPTDLFDITCFNLLNQKSDKHGRKAYS